MNTETVLNVGVVGAGDIARTAHLPTLKHCAGVNVAWVADVDTSRSRALGRAYGVPSLSIGSGIESLPPADVVLLATPYGSRVPYYELFRQRGAAVYVEKPLARTEAEHREICAGFPSYALCSGLMMRSWCSNRLARDIVSSGLFGPLRRARFAHGRPGLVTNGRYYLDPRRGGGGMVSEFGIHGIDSILFASGAVAASVREVEIQRDGEVELHARATLGLTLPGARQAEAEVVVTGLENVVEGVEFEFDGAYVSYMLPGQGYALHGDKIDLRISVRPKANGLTFALTPRDPLPAPETKFQMFHDFWSCFLAGVRTKSTNAATAEAALLTTAVVEKIAKEKGL